MRTFFSPVGRFMLLAGAFVVIVAGMREASTLLVPFLMAIFISVLCSPPLAYLQNRKVPNGLAILIIILVIISVGGILGTIFTSSLAAFAADIPIYTSRLEIVAGELLVWLQGHGLAVDETQWREWFQIQSIFPYATSLLGQFGSLATNAFLIILTVVFILAEEASLEQKLKLTVKDSDKNILDIFRITQSINQYMAIKAAISLLTGVLAFLLCSVVGVEYPVLWGTLAFLLNFIPTLGSLLAAVPPVLLALVQLNPVSAVIVAIGYLIINLVIGQFMEPRIMGRGLGLSPLVVLMSLVFWGWVLGPVGMLLSVPLTMMLKIALEAYPDTRWVGAVLGNLASLSNYEKEPESDSLNVPIIESASDLPSDLPSDQAQDLDK